MQVEKRRLDPVDEIAAYVEKARSTRSAQELPSGCRQNVAADPLDIDRHLSDRLTGIEQERNAGLAGGDPDLLGRVDQAALSRHVGDRDEFHGTLAIAQPSAEVAHRDLAGLVVVDHLDDGAGPSGDLKKRNDVAGVLRPGCEDPVARTEGQAIERHVPRPSRILDDGDLIDAGTDQSGDRGVRVFDLVGRGVRGFVPAHLRFAPQVGDHGVGDLRRGKGGPGVVQMRNVGYTGGVPARALDVEVWAGLGGRVGRCDGNSLSSPQSLSNCGSMRYY